MDCGAAKSLTKSQGISQSYRIQFHHKRPRRKGEGTMWCWKFPVMNAPILPSHCIKFRKLNSLSHWSALRLSSGWAHNTELMKTNATWRVQGAVSRKVELSWERLKFLSMNFKKQPSWTLIPPQAILKECRCSRVAARALWSPPGFISHIPSRIVPNPSLWEGLVSP